MASNRRELPVAGVARHVLSVWSSSFCVGMTAPQGVTKKPMPSARRNMGENVPDKQYESMGS